MIKKMKKASHRLGENIHRTNIGQRMVTRVHTSIITQEETQPIKKMGKRF